MIWLEYEFKTRGTWLEKVLKIRITSKKCNIMKCMSQYLRIMRVKMRWPWIWANFGIQTQLEVHTFCGECPYTVCMPLMIQPIDHSHNLAVPAMADLCMLECCLDGFSHVLGVLWSCIFPSPLVPPVRGHILESMFQPVPGSAISGCSWLVPYYQWLHKASYQCQLLEWE